MPTIPPDANVSTIDQTGLTIESKPNILAYLISAYQLIYGPDINVDSNSPDGQLINIQAQQITDFLELLQDTYANGALNTAYGERLDQLVALNGIQRKAGTYTQAHVLVVVSIAVTLPGLDQTTQTAFTVADNAGNQFQLVTTHVFGSAGSATLVFQAVDIGEVPTIANTITNVITSTLGVTSVNNPSVATDTLGVNEETDAQLKIRHDQSLNLAATGPADAVEAALHNIADVIDAYVVENNTNNPVNGIPARGMWVIVNGGTATEIAQAIYAKKSIGCAMRGTQTAIVTRPNGSTFTAQWDNAVSQNLFIAFSIIWIGAQALQNADIISALAIALVYRLGQSPTIADVLTAMRTIAPTAIVTINSATQGVSVDGILWASQVGPTDPQHYFLPTTTHITIT